MHKKKSNTLLDVILSLIRFNKENQQFFTFILKNLHSGFNKINWGKTIATATSFEERTQKVELQNGDIVYVSLHGWIPKTSQELMDAVNAKDWGIDISILTE